MKDKEILLDIENTTRSKILLDIENATRYKILLDTKYYQILKCNSIISGAFSRKV